MRSKKIIISGAYGMGNLGDEAIFDSLYADCISVCPKAKVTAFVFDREAFLTAHPALAERKDVKVICFFDFFLRRNIAVSSVPLIQGIFALATCDFLMVGGGGLFRDRIAWVSYYLKPLFIAQFFRKKILVSCVGVDRISDPRVIALVNGIKSSVVFRVRDEDSKKNLLAIHRGLDSAGVKVIPDPAFHLSEIPVAKRPHDGLVVGLNLAYWKADYTDPAKLDIFIRSLAIALADFHAQSPFRLVHLPTCQNKDGPAWERLKRSLPAGMALEESVAVTPSDYLKYLAVVDGFIGMRLHSLILSSNVNGLPVVAIAYDDKVTSLLGMLERQPLTIGRIEACPAALVGRMAEMTEKNVGAFVPSSHCLQLRKGSIGIKDEIRQSLCAE